MVLKKLSYEPAIPLLGIYSKEMKSGSQRDICTPMFILYTIAKIWKQPKCPSIDEEIVVHTHTHTHTHTIEYYSIFKMKEILPFVATWMNLEDIMLNGKRQTQKDKYYITSFTCGVLKS